MKYKRLGNTGLMVSELCFGAMSFGDNWGYGSNEEESKACFDAFVEAGGNFFDTACNYTEGNSEKLLGKFIAGQRERFVIASKCTLCSPMGPQYPGDPNATGNGRKHLREELEHTLERLGTDYLDILYVHAWDYRVPVEELMRTLNDFVTSGKVNYLGVSNAPAYIVAEANTIAKARGWAQFSVYEGKYNPLDRTIEREVLPMVEHFDMSLTVWQPLAGALLCGSSEELQIRVNSGYRAPTDAQWEIIHKVEDIAKELEVSVPQVALAWLRQRSSNVIPIIGVRIPEHVIDNLKSLDVHLNDDQMKAINDVSKIAHGYPTDAYLNSVDYMTYNRMLHTMDVMDVFPHFYKQ